MRLFIIGMILSGCVTLKNSPTTVGNNNKVTINEYNDSPSYSRELSDTGKKIVFLGASLTAVAAGCFGADYLWSKGYKAPAELTGTIICLPGIIGVPISLISFAF